MRASLSEYFHESLACFHRHTQLQVYCQEGTWTIGLCIQNDSKPVWYGASPWYRSEAAPPRELAAPSRYSLSRLWNSTYSALSIWFKPHNHPTWLIALPPCKPLSIKLQVNPCWREAWVVNIWVIFVLWFQCLPIDQNIVTTITIYPHNVCLQDETLHHLHNRLRQGNTISISGGRYPNICVISL